MIRPAELERDFGVRVGVLRAHVGGFESDCWVADEAWFVKVWKQPGSPNGLEVLGELRGRGLPVVAPIAAVSGEHYAVHEGRPYAVFPYIPGRTATHDDWRVTARALRQVHELSEPPDLPRVTFDEPEIRQLAQRLDHPWIVDRRDEVAVAIERLDEVIGRVNATPVREVLCHQDFGGLNLMLDEKGEVAAILDWEQAVIGPRQYDVWIAAEGHHLEAFLAEYGAHDLDLDHLEYALLARGLRDMAARVLDDADPRRGRLGLRPHRTARPRPRRVQPVLRPAVEILQDALMGVTVKVGEQDAYLARVGRAGMLLLPMITGIGEQVRDWADELAGRGITALVWDPFKGRSTDNSTREELSAAVARDGRRHRARRAGRVAGPPAR